MTSILYILRTDDRRSTDDRPIDLAFWKISNGHISATGRPIHFIFGSRAGFSGSVDRLALHPIGPNPRSRPYPETVHFQFQLLIQLLAAIHNKRYYYYYNSYLDGKSIGENNARGVIRLVTI